MSLQMEDSHGIGPAMAFAKVSDFSK